MVRAKYCQYLSPSILRGLDLWSPGVGSGVWGFPLVRGGSYSGVLSRSSRLRFLHFTVHIHASQQDLSTGSVGFRFVLELVLDGVLNPLSLKLWLSYNN